MATPPHQIHEPGETPLPPEEERGLAVGIDLGTTNSVVALARAGKTEVISDAAGHTLVPSVVAYRDEEVVGGEDARRQLLDRPQIVVRSIKRLTRRPPADLNGVAVTLRYERAPPADAGIVRL